MGFVRPSLVLALVGVAACTFVVPRLALTGEGDGGGPGGPGVDLAVGSGPDGAKEPADLAEGDLSGRDFAPAPDLAAAPCPTEEPLIACYRFEDAAHPTQLRDDSKHSTEATASNVSFVPGVSGTAVSLNANSSIKASDAATAELNTAFTVELWVRPTAWPADGGRAGLLDDDGRYGFFLAPNGGLRCLVGALTVDTGDSAIALDVWSHVACVYDGAKVHVYANGSEVTASDYSLAVTGGNGNGIAIGGNSPSGDPLTGALDDLHIWRVGRSAAQICAAAGRDQC